MINLFRRRRPSRRVMVDLAKINVDNFMRDYGSAPPSLADLFGAINGCQAILSFGTEKEKAAYTDTYKRLTYAYKTNNFKRP